MMTPQGLDTGARAWSVILLLAALAACTPRMNAREAAEGAPALDANVIAFINEAIQKPWQENKITPSKPAGDYEFLRRVYLDIIGRIPTVEEIQAFRKRPEKSRRAQEIDRLLKHDDYARNWANLWTVWLLTRTSPQGVSRATTHSWLEKAFAANRPYNLLVDEVLTATGKTDENGAVNFVLQNVGERTARGQVADPNDPDKMMGREARDGLFEMVPATSRTTRLFLGIQTQCTQCHDHPFVEGRKHQQYWGVNAFFRQVVRSPESVGRREQAVMMSLDDDLARNPSAEVYFERRNGAIVLAKATYLDGTKLAVDPSQPVSRRKELAKLVTKDKYFSQALVNRMWAHFLGRGFTNPMDDLGNPDNSPVSHPELFDRLAAEFVAAGHDVRRLIRWICNSRPYQLSSASNKTNEKSDAEPFFSRMLLKALTPEQLVDSIFVATSAEGAKSSKEDQGKWLKDFTVNFGDDEGNEATYNGTIVQALMLMNGAQLNDATRAKPGSTLQKAMSIPSPEERLRYLYLSVLTRPPAPSELELAKRVVGTYSKDPSAPWQDILWALLNSNEFILNH